MEVVVRLGSENWLTEPALRELRRWPVTPTLELRPPISPREASQLRKLKRFRARLAYGSAKDRSLRRLAPALASVRAGPRTPLPVKDRPCPGTALMGRAGADERSEERRVGKEGRCGRSRALANAKVSE